MKLGKTIMVSLLLASHILIWGNLLYQWRETSIEPFLTEYSNEKNQSVHLKLETFDPYTRLASFYSETRFPSQDVMEYDGVVISFSPYVVQNLQTRLLDMKPTSFIEEEIIFWGSKKDVLMEVYGWYPFEKYAINVCAYATINRYDDSGNQQYPSTTIHLGIDFLGKQYGYIAKIFRVKDSDPNCSIVIIQREESAKQVFMVLVLILVFLLFIMFFTHDFPSFIQVSTGFLIGVLGLKNVIIPDNLSFQSKQGVNGFLYDIYILFGLMIIIWIIDSRFGIAFPSIYNKVISDLFRRNENTWTTKDVSIYLQITEKEVQRMARVGDIPARKGENGRWQYNKKLIIARNMERHLDDGG